MKKTMLVLAVLAMVAMITAPAMAAQYLEQFNYADGALVGQGGWTGNAGQPITVDAGSAKLRYDNAYRGLAVQQTGIGITGPVVYASVDIYIGGMGSGLGGGNAFDIAFNDQAGLNYARLYGGYSWERPRINGYGGAGEILGNLTLLAGQWNRVTAMINTTAKTSDIYLNGGWIGQMGYNLYGHNAGITGTVDQVRIGFQNSGTDNNGDYKFYDNVYVGTTFGPVVPEPSSFMALGMFGLGALGFIKRRK